MENPAFGRGIRAERKGTIVSDADEIHQNLTTLESHSRACGPGFLEGWLGPLRNASGITDLLFFFFFFFLWGPLRWW